MPGRNQRTRSWTAAVAACLVTGPVPAQDMEPLWNQGAFQATLESFQSLEPAGLRDQMTATFYTFVGRQDRLARLEGEIAGPSLFCVEEDTGVEWRTGADWVLEAARDRRVLMLNENHYRVEARLFASSLLERLSDLGFTHLGLEAFMPAATVMENAAGWSGVYSPENGFYTHEPVFAALIRQAQELGFDVFGYEFDGEMPANATADEHFEIREEAQANNIIGQLEGAGPQARFVIFAGWAHIAEGPLGSSGRLPMAARFREKTGIDPLTVDLTGCAYETRSERPSMTGRIALDANGSALVAGQYRGLIDAQVHLPVPAPGIAATGFYRRALGVPVSVPQALRANDEAVLVRAHSIEHGLEATPVDQVLLEPGENLALYLPAGREYELISHRGDGEVVGRRRIALE